jgi:predicted aspartyl protease
MDAALKAMLTYANARYREGQFREAEQFYSQAYELDSHNTGILTRLGEIALWKNQTEAAEHYFKQALGHASRLGRKWPLSIQLKNALAMTYYRQDRFPQAAQFFKEAAGPLPVHPFRDLKAMGNQLALFDTQTPYRIEGAETGSIPFTQTDPLPVIQVSVNGSEPISFFIDTGGAEVILDIALAERLGIVWAGTLAGEGGGTKGHIGLGKLDTLMLGDVSVHNIPIHIMDTNPFAAVFDGLPVKGIIGTRLLMHFLATIDYLNGCLILRRKTAGAQIETRMAKVIPFWLIQTHYIVANGIINGKNPMLFFVDTGLADKGFSATESTLQAAGIPVDWSKAEKSIAAFSESETVDITADRMTLGTGADEVVALHLPGVAFKKPFPVLGYTLGFWIGGVVSHQFFRNYALTLDFVGMRLILQE